jgi:hypothetical protein
MYWINLIIPGVILLPNLIYFWVAPSGTLEDWNKEHPPFLTIMEWVGRAGVILTPIFTPLQIESVGEDMAAIVMIVFLIIYYIAWFRYFAFNMKYEYLFKTLTGIPLPLAISPVFYFLFASYPLHSIALLVSTIIFAISHIWITIRSYRQFKEEMRYDQ